MAMPCVCSECRLSLEDGAPESRRPCPNCGSRNRTFGVAVDARVQTNAYLKTRTKRREGGRKVVREVTEGDDYHRESGKWNVMRRVIDRLNNVYSEIFWDRHTREVVHKTEEPLTEHKHNRKRS